MKKKLPLIEMIKDALLELRSGGLPLLWRFVLFVALIVAVIWLIGSIVPHERLASILAFLIVVFILSKFMVMIHRMAILKHPLPGIVETFFTVRKYEWRFFGWMIFSYFFIALGTLVIGIPLGIAGATLFESPESMEASTLFMFMILLSQIYVYYTLARLTLVFPASAVGQEYSLDQSWRATQSNGLRLILLVFLLPGIVLFLIEQLQTENLFMDLLVMFLMVLWMAFSVALLSRCYLFFYPHGDTADRDEAIQEEL